MCGLNESVDLAAARSAQVQFSAGMPRCPRHKLGSRRGSDGRTQ